MDKQQQIKVLSDKIAYMKNTFLFIKHSLAKISAKGHQTGYDWNSDPEYLTRLEGDIFKAIADTLRRSQ